MSLKLEIIHGINSTFSLNLTICQGENWSDPATDSIVGIVVVDACEGVWLDCVVVGRVVVIVRVLLVFIVLADKDVSVRCVGSLKGKIFIFISNIFLGSSKVLLTIKNSLSKKLSCEDVSSELLFSRLFETYPNVFFTPHKLYLASEAINMSTPIN